MYAYKVIFVKSLICYADGIIKKIHLNPDNAGNRTAHPITIYYDVQLWKNEVPLKEQEVINFLANVSFENSKYGADRDL